MAPNVVAVHADDWRLVRDLRLRALADSPRSFGSSLERELTFGEEDWIGLVCRGRWFRATSDGASIGIAAGLRGEGLATDEAHLISFWVDPASRGTGVAAQLLEAVLDWARSSGTSRLTLWVADESPAARRFYLRMGFLPTGQRQPLPSHPAVGEELMAIDLGQVGRPPTPVEA